GDIHFLYPDEKSITRLCIFHKDRLSNLMAASKSWVDHRSPAPRRSGRFNDTPIPDRAQHSFPGVQNPIGECGDINLFKRFVYSRHLCLLLSGICVRRAQPNGAVNETISENLAHALLKCVVSMSTFLRADSK